MDRVIIHIAIVVIYAMSKCDWSLRLVKANRAASTRNVVARVSVGLSEQSGLQHTLSFGAVYAR